MNTRMYIIPLSISGRLCWLDFKIHEVGYPEHLVIDGDIVFY
jgi:hypothetical protein